MGLSLEDIFQIVLIAAIIAGLISLFVGLGLLWKGIFVGQTEISFPRWGILKTSNAGVVALFLAVVLLLVSIFSFQQSDNLRFERHKLNNLTLKAGLILKQNYDAGNYNAIESIADFITAAEPFNGHALYFAGEAKRALGKPEEGVKFFYAYLNTEPTLPEAERSGGMEVNVCYQRPKGYCRQRTAWIQHLLANHLYGKALKETETAARRALLKSADNHVENIWPDFPDGFIQRTAQTRPTKALKERICRELKAIQARCKAPPVGSHK